MRVFGSESLLRNLAILSDTSKLTENDINFIDTVMK